MSDDLKALALRATPGPWTAIRSHSYCGPHVRADGVHAAVVYGRSWSSARDGSADVEYIAAANPAAIEELCRELDDLKAKLEAAERERDTIEARTVARAVTRLVEDGEARVACAQRDAAIQRAEQAEADREKLREAWRAQEEHSRGCPKCHAGLCSDFDTLWEAWESAIAATAPSPTETETT